MLAPFSSRILGQYPAAPCSPGPFGLLLKKGDTHQEWTKAGPVQLIKKGLIRSYSGTLALKKPRALVRKSIGRFSETQKWIY